MFDYLRNTFLNRRRYKTHSEAVIVACFFNPQNSPYRLLAFQKWYHSIRHLNHRILECLLGEARSQLPKDKYISQVRTDSLLWHKESLLNKVIAELPDKFRYVFWVDADVLFTNHDWLVEGVERLRTCNIIQPFEYCVHLERNQVRPDFNVDDFRSTVGNPERRHPHLWRSFCANHLIGISGDANYDRHGHVGFAWGARREVLDSCRLFDRGLIGGADHIMAHAAAGQIPHSCISKSFTDNLDEVLAWSRDFYGATGGVIGYAKGDLYHIWHGDIADRQYFKRVKDFTGETKGLRRDGHGLFIKRNSPYMKSYYRQREVPGIYEADFGDFDAGFFEDMGYQIWDFIQLFGAPNTQDDVPTQDDSVLQDNFQDTLQEPQLINNQLPLNELLVEESQNFS